ncbi:MAG: energy-coupling factor transport system substrate-specific component [Solirubrobacteraceae bacterium]|nr:energy-coupling factor transport system substrate-specific component [Solirubrobacteraceae bacterium]
MSWQLASFAIVLAALAVAFWWYERSEPPAKLLAVVATLAALAALGRDAFAAIPDVKPITAIVLVGGIAFGARPGFAIGAIAALASNILLGEGPWTPWQMLGWGIVGLLGAGLGAALRERRPPPLLLALACALSAEVFNLVLDVYTWTGTGNHSLAGFGLVLGSALVFDLTHVAASFAFGLAFGPGLLRMLVRVRARLQVSWEAAPAAPRPPGLAALLGGPPSALALLLSVPVLALGVTACANATKSATGASGAAQDARVAVGRELAYLASAQNPDGGFGAAPGLQSSELYSAWAAIGLAAGGRSPLSLSRGGRTVLDALKAEATTLNGAGDLERTILALRACGVSVRALPGGDPVARLLRFRATDGSFTHLSNLTAFGILALRAAGYGPRASTVAKAGRWLARQQNADGGFSFGTRGGGSDVDDTAAAMQALAAASPRRGQALARAASFLRHAQNLDGGYPQQVGGTSNAQSTAWAVQGLTVAGADPRKVRRGGSVSPLAYLESLILANGSVRYSRTGAQTPVWVTAQALTALAGRPFPITAPGG